MSIKLYGIYYKDARNAEHRYDDLPHGRGYGRETAELLCSTLKRSGVDAYPKCVVTIHA